MHISGSGKRLEEVDLDQFERRSGQTIPSAYREFLMKHNGGEPSRSYFELGSAREPVDIRSFLGILLTEETLNIDYVLTTFGDDLPSGFFPIARDPGGNIIGIDDKGAVVFWDHESAGDEGVRHISPSFEQFLASLRES